MNAVARPRKNKAIVIGAVALALSAVIAAAAGYWWQERNKPSQASRTDCVLAQELVDSSRQIPRDKAAIEKWVKNEQRLRSQLEDGYLGAGVSNYNGLAVLHAKGEGTPSKMRLQQLEDEANGHCADAGVKLVFPPIAS